MSAQLVVTDGTNRGDSFPIKDDAMLLLGRDDGCDIQLHDPTVSRAHCRIGYRDGRVRVADAGSSSGTWVNGKKITDQELHEGDQIALGDTRLRFYSGPPSAAATLPPSELPADVQRGIAHSQDSKSAPLERFAEENSISSPAAEEAREPVSGKSRARPVPGDLARLVGRTLEGYTLTEVVSRTSSGLVFRGRETEGGRAVAVKVLWPELTSHQSAEPRFLRAVKTMMPIRHRNLVALYGGGCSADGYCWCAMEWVEGETVHDAIGRIGICGMLDWSYAIRAAHGVACALEFIYEHQIVHRNILPRNIFVQSDGGQIKLGDLILAKALDGSQAEKITGRGEIIGELGFLAPEQLAGGDQVDCRSDIYNLGAAVYAILTGRPPFSDDSPVSTITMIHKDRPVNPTKYQLSIPPLFEGVVLKMLAKRPDDRFPTPTKLVLELERVARFQGMELS